MSRRYVLCPGIVTSKSDGQRHYVGPAQLARLYGVPFSECVIFPQEYAQVRGWLDPPGAVYLRPRYDGDYSLPDGAQ